MVTDAAPPDPPDGDVGLFIDWENFKYSLYEVGQMPHVAALMQAVRERYGRPVVARAYADWQDYYHRKSADQMNLYAAGIEPVYVPTRPSPGHAERIKNSVDVRMSLDCLEASFTHRHLQTFVLVTGDADFQHVVGALRRRGARVVMIGVSGSTALRLAAVVDEMLFYDVDVDRLRPAVTPEAPTAEQRTAEPPPQTNGARPAESKPIESKPIESKPIESKPIESKPIESKPAEAKTIEARVDELAAAAQALVDLVRRQREIEDGRNYPPLLSWLQIQMRDLPPFFVPQKYGFARFKDFVAQVERHGALAVQTQDMTDRVWLAEDAAERLRQASPLAPPPPDGSWAEDDQLARQRDEFADIVLTADDIENSHREYMGRSLLARFLYNKGHWDPANLPARAAPIQSPAWRTLEMPDIYRLLEAAEAKGILLRTTHVDPSDGFEVTAVQLDRAHPFVRHVLTTVTFP